MLHFNRDEKDDRYWHVVVHPIASESKEVATILKYPGSKTAFVTPANSMMPLSALQHLAKGAEMIADSDPETERGYFSLGRGVGKGYTHE